jgi:hypothetical protein
VTGYKGNEVSGAQDVILISDDVPCGELERIKLSAYAGGAFSRIRAHLYEGRIYEVFHMLLLMVLQWGWRNEMVQMPVVYLIKEKSISG